MNKIITLIILFIFLSITSDAQNKYSDENLRNYSEEELNTYLQKAMKLRKTGGTLAIIGGGVVAISGTWLLVGDYGLEGIIGAWVLIGGLGFMTVGIPMRIVNTNRIDRINNILNPVSAHRRIDIMPEILTNYSTNSYSPGIKIRITF